MLLVNLIVLILAHVCLGDLQGHSPHTFPGLRIINGRDASKNALPSMVFVSVSKEGIPFNCGGSLIHKQFVLTAGHCLDHATSAVRRVMFGVHKYDRSDAVQTLQAASFAVNPDYLKDKCRSAAHDLAIIKLAQEATIRPGVVEVARLPPAVVYPADQEVYVNQQPTMYGWGLIKQKPEQPPKVLQTVQGKIVPYASCKSAKRARDNVLCMGRLDGKLGIACYGDSGSPLILNGLQIGVVSGGSIVPMACHRSEYALFARVDYHKRWIDTKIRNM